MLLLAGRRISIVTNSFLFALVSLITVTTNLYLASNLPDGSSRRLPFVRVEEEDETTSSDILHIVTTRFMQHQPDLIHLGEARLVLFETFCFPSMTLQTTTDFIWAVLVDPDLDEQLLRRLEELLQPYPNFYLVLSNEKGFELGGDPNALRDEIRAGDFDNLMAIMNNPDRKLLLHTRLDADDGLHKKTLAKIQEAARNFPEEPVSGWQVVCANLHFEWRNNEILALNVTSGGTLRLVQEQICITPGFTFVQHRNATEMSIPKLPRVQHHLLTRDYPECFDSHNTTVDCWQKLPQLYPAALRSRTITSAGMSRVQLSKQDQSKSKIFDNHTAIFWGAVEHNFGTTPNDAFQVSKYLVDHMEDIIQDNLDGQCSPGHSCKNSSKETLLSILNDARSSSQQR